MRIFITTEANRRTLDDLWAKYNKALKSGKLDVLKALQREIEERIAEWSR